MNAMMGDPSLPKHFKTARQESSQLHGIRADVWAMAVILSGSSHVLYGVGHADVGEDFDMDHPQRGRTFTLNPGDVIVHPAYI